MALRKEEINRKLLHLFALIMPVGLFYFPLWGIPYAVPVALLAFFVVGSVIVETLRFHVPAVHKIFCKCFGYMLREEEKSANKVTGSTYVVGAALICSFLFINHPHISFMVLTMFILGDAIAAIVGLSIGRIKIGKKSLEGSAACFLLCMVLFYALFAHLPVLLDVWRDVNNDINAAHYLLIAVAASLSITLFELIPLKITKKIIINDNLAVPVITGGVILLMERLLLGGGEVAEIGYAFRSIIGG
jgi:dolichol kinase